MKERLHNLRRKLYNLREDINTFFTYPFVHAKFVYQTETYPKKVEHHWCKFYDWVTETEKEGWYVLDKRGDMIPWVHFDDNSLICLYPSMITPIEK